MSHAGTRVQEHIGDPVSEAPALPRAKLEEIFSDIQSDLRYDHELNGCLNCGICTATCPAAHYYDFSPREIVQLLWTENLEGIYAAMQEKIWACAQCYTCAARCPFGMSRTARRTASENSAASRSSSCGGQSSIGSAIRRPPQSASQDSGSRAARFKRWRATFRLMPASQAPN